MSVFISACLCWVSERARADGMKILSERVNLVNILMYVNVFVTLLLNGKNVEQLLNRKQT